MDEMNKALLESMRWYREQDFLGMRDDVREEILNLYKDDGEEPSKSAKLQISTNAILIGQVFKDERLIRLGLNSTLAKRKAELIEILDKLSIILNEETFK